MNKTETLAAIDAKIIGTKALLHNNWDGHDVDHRREVPSVTKAQVEAEIARLEAARKDVESWADEEV